MSLDRTNVIYENQPGVLEVHASHITFSPHKTSTALITIPTSKITKQLVNSNKSNKALMILATGDRDDEKFRFQFTGGRSVEEERVVRDKFKDRIASVINAARMGSLNTTENSKLDASTLINNTSTTTSKQPLRINMDELKARQLILASDPSTRKLHKDLVLTTQHLSEEEFWETRQHLFWSVREEKKQERGLASQLVHDVRPASSEAGEVKFVLTPDIIRSIFLHHPRSTLFICISDRIGSC